MKKLLFSLCFLTSLLSLSQSVTLLPGEDSVNVQSVYVGDQNFFGNYCIYNQGKGMLSISMEISNRYGPGGQYLAWDEHKLAFFYNGAWHNILDINAIHDPNTTRPNYLNYNDQNHADSSGNYPMHAGVSNAHMISTTGTFFLAGGAAPTYFGSEIYLKNIGNLNIYDTTYLPITPKIDNRTGVNQFLNYSIQTLPHSSSHPIPTKNPPPAWGVYAEQQADDIRTMYYSNLPGVFIRQHDQGSGGNNQRFLVINIVNLPPEMISSNSFRVHLYSHDTNPNQANTRVAEWIYNTPNFMSAGPQSLTASNNKCNGVLLNWANSQNSAPSDGQVIFKTVILRDGQYLTTLSETANSYTDLTAMQDSTYQYQVMHVAFSESGDTYYKSPLSSTVTGQRKPRADEPISPTATDDLCNSKITVEWDYNGSNPESFRIDSATTAAGPFDTLAINISGAARSFDHLNVTRGQDYFYRIYAYNSCGVISDTFALTNGISPSDPTPASNLSTTVNAVAGTVTLEWDDNASNETKYEVIRQDNAGNTVYFNVNPNDTLYVDNGVSPCVSYTYSVRVYNECVLSGLLNTGASPVAQLPPPMLGATFASPNYFKGSKGYFVNRVELDWNNSNNTVLDFIKIYRKPLGSAGLGSQIGSVSPGTQIYADYTADAGVFYEYSLVGEKYCLGTTYYTDTISDIGFRSASGIVNGHVEYNGGVAVEGVRVTVDPANGSSGNSLLTAVGDTAIVQHSNDFDFTTAFTIGAYVKMPSHTTNMTIVEKPGAYSLKFKNNNDIELIVQSGGAQTVTYNAAIDDASFHHIAAVYNGTHLKLILDGNPVDSIAFSGSITTNTNDIYIGIVDADSMYIDELRFYNVAKSNVEMFQDFSRVVRGNHSGLKAYYRFNEGAGSASYDLSFVGSIYNENHASFAGSPTFSLDIPTAAQLNYAGYTNASGDYTVPVSYNGIGEIFTATPSFLTHQFSPGSQSMFIGDNSQIQNGVDFLDISSFPVAGNVRYYDGTCPLEDAFLYVDGNIVIQNGVPAKTDASGNFTIQVPIGNHFVTVGKNQHIFSDGRWPATGTYDFQAPVSGIQFIDSTYIKVIGRVVGGTRESSKPMIPGRSNNNIGQAEIVFTSLNGCYSDTIETTLAHGDYVAYLHPLKLQIPDFSVSNLGDPNFTTFSDPIFSNNQILDLSTIPPVQKIVDTLFTDANHTTWSSIDSVEYQTIRSWTYRSAPGIWVKDTNGTDFKHTTAGDGELYYTDPVTEVVDTVVLPSKNALGFPVFHERRNYAVNVGVTEVYQDNATGLVDSVPVTTGNVLINNGLSQYPVTSIQLSDTSVYKSWNLDTCYYRYNFKGGNPSINYTNGDPNNYSQLFGIQYSGGPNTANWQPDGNDFRGIVIGGKSADGQSFVTLGPQVPTMVLRDPPGSQSYSSLEVGETIVNTSSWSVAENLGASLSTEIELGTEFTTGIGMEVETDVENSLTIGASVESSISQEGTFVEALTMTQSWATSPDVNFVGSTGDVYLGKSMNITFGLSRNIMLLTDAQCSLSGIECRTETINVGGVDYRIGKKVSLSAAPGGYATSFIYTQDHIVNKLLPNLRNLRDQLFITKPATYVSNLSAGDPHYGKNNDDPSLPVVSTADPISTEANDTTGYSYTFHAPAAPIVLQYKSALDGTVHTDTLAPAAGDSVRWYNQQIRLWEQAIAMNEQDKYEAIQDPNQLIQNYSFSSGIEYVNSATTESTETFDLSFEVGVTTEMAIAIGGSVGGTGVGVEAGLSLNLSAGGGFGKEHTNSTTFAYTFNDEDVGDFFSVDVRNSKRGWGPIFNTVAGESSCPWEGTDSSLYFQDLSGNNVALSTATLKRELVEMKVDGNLSFSQKLNVPANSTATFNLEIINHSETNDDIDYGIKVLSETNPDGAILSIDGYTPSSQVYPVPANSSINKTLVLQRGSIEFAYDSIAVVVHSLCDDPIVGDTIYVSAHFLPSCSEVDIQYPLNQWVMNNSYNDTLPIVIDGYDINYNGLEKISLEVKKSSVSTWIPIENWYRTVVTPGPDSLEIPTSQAFINYQLAFNGFADADYDIRATSTCVFANNESIVYTGVVDRINPHPFGTPSPADGILDPNDDISIQMNEPVDIGATSVYNFDVRGVLNGGSIRHSESLNFDGVSDYAHVIGGANLKERSFSFEFWAKLNGTGINQTVFSQGNNPAQSLVIGFNAADQFEFSLGGQSVNSTSAVPTPGNWHHYAVVYDYDNSQALLYIDGTLSNSGNINLFFNYQGEGKLAFGKQLPANNNFFNGNIHELRLWNKAKSAAEVTQTMNLELAGNESGLLYNWKCNETYGQLAEDHVRARNADLFGTTWEVNPNGYSASFDGVDDYISINSATIPVTKEMDFTLEFWFRSSQMGQATLFSNGHGNGLEADSLLSWNIQKDASGIIHVYHHGMDFLATSQNYFDGNWHHFALVMNRNSNLSSYIDGNLESSTQAIPFQQMGANEMYLGTHGKFVATVLSTSDFYQGDIDEFRFWNASRKLEQIRRDSRNRMLGDEYALEAYLPFETYQGIPPVLNSTLNDQSENSLTVSDFGGLALSNQTPTLRLPRPVQAVPFTYSVNNDKIIITPTASSDLIEKVTLDITVKDIEDLHGNQMQSPKTWIAFVNKNQVLWQDDEFTFSKPEDSVITFTTNIVNSGGAAKNFTIGALPNWISASITSGLVGPNSTYPVTFTIQSGYSVGEYFADVSLTTDFGYAEILRVNLEVVGNPPNWNVNPSNFAYNMAIIGEIEIDGIINTNTSSMLAAFISDSLCGVGNLQYVPAYDRYEVFLNVYSNAITGDSIEFKIYDASTGLTFVEVTPNIMFLDGDVQGTASSPITFQASTIISIDIPLNKGWTWISLPLETSDLQNSNLFTSDLLNQTGDVLKGQDNFDQFDVNVGWLGGLSAGGGYLNAESYKFFKGVKDTLTLEGSRIHPDSSIALINLDAGWNWIGFVSVKKSDLATALGQLTPAAGDIIKSQHNFAMYDASNGWLGSLTEMRPGLGYMYKSAAANSFNYPISLFYGKGTEVNQQGAKLPDEYSFDAANYSKNMSMVVSSNLCQEVEDLPSLALIAVGEDGTIRGLANPVEINGETIFFLTVHSNTDGEALSFKYVNLATGDEVLAIANTTFSNNGVQGIISSPFYMDVHPDDYCSLVNATSLESEESNTYSIYPNPVKDHVNIEFNDHVELSITIRDMHGRIIDQLSVNGAGIYRIELTDKYAAGVYTVELNGDIESTHKLVKY
jgi:hypothetical protein